MAGVQVTPLADPATTAEIASFWSTVRACLQSIAGGQPSLLLHLPDGRGASLLGRIHPTFYILNHGGWAGLQDFAQLEDSSQARGLAA